jgi:primase-polymerase (primpol)-like protein
MISNLDQAIDNMLKLWYQARDKGDATEMRLFKSIGVKLRALQHKRDNPQTNIDTYNSAKNIFDATPVDK